MESRTNRNLIRKIGADRRGFTLIETVVALAVLTMAVAGPMTLAIKNIGSATVSQEQMTAFYLAQEGAEYVRNKIDSIILGNALGGGNDDWLYGLDNCRTANGCYIDVNTGEITECDAVNGCEYLKVDETGKYNYSASDVTVFNRKIKITASDLDSDGDNDEAKIKSTVKWSDKYTKNREFVFYDYVYDWR